MSPEFMETSEQNPLTLLLLASFSASAAQVPGRQADDTLSAAVFRVRNRPDPHRGSSSAGYFGAEGEFSITPTRKPGRPIQTQHRQVVPQPVRVRRGRTYLEIAPP